MLKNVVLPAPLGPMIDTIERSGTRNDTLSTAVRPPNCFVSWTVSRIAGPDGRQGRLGCGLGCAHTRVSTMVS